MTKRLSALSAAVFLAAVAVFTFPVNVSAQPAPESENGRYTFTPSADGVLRLDTRSGSIASCHNRVSGWACYTVPDERAALDTEIGRLQKENGQLKNNLADMRGEQQRFSDELAKLKQAYAVLEAKPRTDMGAATLPHTESKQDQIAEAKKNNKIELQLPDEKDMERVVSFLERAWRNLIAMADRVQKDVSGKI